MFCFILKSVSCVAVALTQAAIPDCGHCVLSFEKGTDIMKIGIIGFGNLGSALASGLIRSCSVSAGDIYVCDSSPVALSAAEAAPVSAKVSQDINVVIRNSDVIFLTIKSHVFEVLARDIDRSALAGKTVVSFMAGVGFEEIFRLIGEVSLVRAMPSLAIASCDGVIGYTKAPPAVSEIFNKLGYAFESKPEDIEKVMAFSSCGLGFAAYLIEAFAAAGQTMGFTAEESASIAAVTFRNAVDRGAFSDTVKAVATPGGATEQGVLHMKNNDINDIVAGAVRKAYERMT